MLTYSLLKRASQQLELLSVASDSDDSISSDDLPRSRRKQQRTKRSSHSGPIRRESGPTEAKTGQNEPKTDHRPSDRAESAGTVIEVAVGEERGSMAPSSPLTSSLFPGQEPTIHFPLPNEPCGLKEISHSFTHSLSLSLSLSLSPPDTPLPPALRSQLKWKMSSITPNVIKNCISRAGFRPCTSNQPLAVAFHSLIQSFSITSCDSSLRVWSEAPLAYIPTV